ncbi:hypothetical protein ACH4K2_29305, partial [Streptomyces globisporus]
MSPITIAGKAMTAARFIERNVATRRFEIPAVGSHLSAAIAVAEGHVDADGGKGIGPADAMNVALAAAYRTEAIFTSDRHFRMVRGKGIGPADAMNVALAAAYRTEAIFTSDRHFRMV